MKINTLLKKTLNLQIKKCFEHENYEQKSFSQSGEDLIIDYIFKNKGHKISNYLDVGSNHPYFLNNTFLFYLRGIRGVNIDADVEMIDLFNTNRPYDNNLNIGIGLKNGDLPFYIMENSVLNTFSEEEFKMLLDYGHKLKTIKQITIRNLNDIISKYFGGVFPDFLNIDIEGIDEDVFNNLDFSKSRPKVLCLETVVYKNKGFGLKKVDYIKSVIDRGFKVYADTNVNTIFISEEFNQM